MNDSNILIYNVANGVATITLNRPDKLNAFNDELTFALQDALDGANKDINVRALIITGAGRGFCAGQDLASRNIKDSDTSFNLGDSIRKRYNPIIIKMRKIEKPIIAAINGVAAGAGASLAFACDFRLALDSVKFIQSFSKVGLVPDSGSTFFLTRLIGLTKAFELMLLADPLMANEALNFGLINKVCSSQDELMNEVNTLANKLSVGPSFAYGLTKRAVNKAIFPDLEEMLEYEANLQELAGKSLDFNEGVQAFLNKRDPVYQGK